MDRLSSRLSCTLIVSRLSQQIIVRGSAAVLERKTIDIVSPFSEICLKIPDLSIIDRFSLFAVVFCMDSLPFSRDAPSYCAASSPSTYGTEIC